MKKMSILILSALMLVSPLFSTAGAVEMLRTPGTIMENKHGRRDDRRRNDRDRRKKKSNTGAIVGAAIGGLIVGGMIASSRQEARREPVLVCNSYGTCWYEER